MTSAVAHANEFARQGKVAEVEKCLSNGSIQITDVLVSCAVESKSTQLLEVLLKYGWDINKPESPREPPFLGVALRYDQDVNLIKWFLKNGADPNRSCDAYCVTPLSKAAQYAPFEIVRLLFEYGASAKIGYPMNFACSRTDQDLEVLKFLVEKGAFVNTVLYGDEPDDGWAQMFGKTPLMAACARKNFNTIKFLLEHGADPRKSTPGGISALSEAKRLRQQEIVDILSAHC